MKTLYYPLIGILLLILSCSKPPDYPDEPIITYERVSVNTLPQDDLLQYSFRLTLSFTDGDGDLGDENNFANVRVWDSRIGIELDTNTLSIPFIPVQGAGNGISGEMHLLLYSACCIFEGRNCEPFPELPVDTLTYLIEIEDRAGNVSNRIESEPIFLTCD